MKKNTVINFMKENAFHAVNSFEPTGEELKDKSLPGVKIYQNIPYDSRWPNSFLDLYLHEKKSDKPLIVYIHGGGFCWGDKAWESEQWFKDQLVFAGYDMVTFNYAFSPEFLYPVQVHQLNEGLKSLPKLAEEYGFAADRLVFSGSSAGSQLCGQLANLISNPDYAAEMGIAPSVNPENLAGLLLGSALLDTNRFGKTGFFMTNWLFRKCAASYFGKDDLYGDPNVEQANVISHATAALPPVYLTDANAGSFSDQAEDFSQRLTQLGVKNELNLYSRKEGFLMHGYENSESECAKDNMRKTLKFLAALS